MHRGRQIRQQLQPVAHTRPMPLWLAGEFPELGPLFCPSLPPTLLQQPLQRMPLELEGRGKGVHRRLITICGKFAAVRHGIWQIGPRHLEKFSAGKTVFPTDIRHFCQVLHTPNAQFAEENQQRASVPFSDSQSTTQRL